MIGATSSNSTDTIVAVFRELIVAATRSGRRFELQFAPKAKDNSYFEHPRRPILSRADLEATGSMNELSMLAELWRAQGYGELLEIVERLAGIAKLLAVESKDGTTQLPSSFIYQMY
jgi:hypothetical protein